MKHRIVYLALIFAVFPMTAQLVSSSCSAADSITRQFRNDADRLAIRHANRTRSLYKDSITISRQVSADYLNALISVYNATLLPANDTITRLLNIHTYNPGLNSLVVVADSNLVWMTNLRYGILPTRDNYIDKMMRQYTLRKVFYSGLLQPSMVVFRTETNRNLAPLARSIKSLVGVKAAEAEYLYGDGNDITDSITDKYTELVYSYGWQDCSAGCMSRRFWRFRVYADCSVEYMGSYGSSLEPVLTLTVLENDSLFNNIRIYPGPAKNKLYIEKKGTASANTSLTITNRKNEIVYALKKIPAKQEVDLILFPNGSYRLTLQDNLHKKTYKLDKP